MIEFLSGSIDQPAMYHYDQITFPCFHIATLLELPSQTTMNQPTGIFVIHCLLTGRLQVRILFEESLEGPPTEVGGPFVCLAGVSIHLR